MTNYEMIRNMSIEEMAVTITCPNEMGLAEIECDHSDDHNCRQCCLNWLKKEVTVRLKKCPFCGGEGDIAVGTSYGFSKEYEPYCRKCGASLGIYITETEAIAAWNRRPEPKEIIPNKRIHGIGKCPVCKQELYMDDENLHYCPTCGTHLIAPKVTK
ncbi:MAG: Lar family restriction alleviation protein [Anaerovoracaceae bacterium]|jgi:Lar family restriction alleviation protein